MTAVEYLSIYDDSVSTTTPVLRLNGIGNLDTTERNAILTNMDGLLGSEVELETVPKLYGQGEYVVSHRMNGKTIDVEGEYFGDWEVIAASLRTTMMNASKLRLVFTHKIGSTTVNDTINVYITKLGDRMRYLDGRTTISMTFRSLDALPTRT